MGMGRPDKRGVISNWRCRFGGRRPSNVDGVISTSYPPIDARHLESSTRVAVNAGKVTPHHRERRDGWGSRAPLLSPTAEPAKTLHGLEGLELGAWLGFAWQSLARLCMAKCGLYFVKQGIPAPPPPPPRPPPPPGRAYILSAPPVKKSWPQNVLLSYVKRTTSFSSFFLICSVPLGLAIQGFFLFSKCRSLWNCDADCNQG